MGDGLQHFGSVIIGSGQAAASLASGLRERGQTVALIEGDQLGGSCVNYGCTPTKTLRKSARVAHLARRARDFGVITGPVEVDFAAAMRRMRERVEASRGGLTSWLAGLDGVEVIRGWGAFDGRNESGHFNITIGDRRISAERVFINTGTRAFIPPTPGLDRVTPLDNTSLLALTERPEHLVVVGGSYIGLEMGQIFRRLGSKVTILHRAARVAEREDADVSEAIAEIFRNEDIDLRLDARIASVGRSMRGSLVTLEDGSDISCSHILFATGRIPNSDKLNLPSVGLAADSRGFIETDAMLRTAVPGIWALGDINRRGAFTHTSYHDHEIVLAAWDDLAGLYQWKNADVRPTTYAMFTDPPLGRVGMTLAEARSLAARGRKILFADLPMSRIGRAKEEGETAGLIRLIVDGESEAFLGATILGIGGDEIIAVISNFMATGASYRIMQQALPVHPTVAEFLPSVLADLKPLESSDV